MCSLANKPPQAGVLLHHRWLSLAEGKLDLIIYKFTIPASYWSDYKRILVSSVA